MIMLLPLLSSLGLGQSGICWGKTESRAILKAANAQNTNVNIGWKLELVPVGSTVRYEILSYVLGQYETL